MGSSFPLWDREGPLLPNIMWFKNFFLFLSVISIAVCFDIYDQRNPLYKRNSYMAYSGQNYDRTLPYVPRYRYPVSQLDDSYKKRAWNRNLMMNYYWKKRFCSSLI